MQMLVFDFPGVTSQQYDRLCRSLNDGRPLTSLAEFHRAGYHVVSHAAGPDTLRFSAGTDTADTLLGF